MLIFAWKWRMCTHMYVFLYVLCVAGTNRQGRTDKSTSDFVPRSEFWECSCGRRSPGSEQVLGPSASLEGQSPQHPSCLLSLFLSPGGQGLQEKNSWQDQSHYNCSSSVCSETLILFFCSVFSLLAFITAIFSTLWHLFFFPPSIKK